MTLFDSVYNIDYIDLKKSNEIVSNINNIQKITEEEINQLIKIMDTKKCSYDAINNLRKYTKTSYYQQINGEKYDRSLLLLAENLLKGQGDGRISHEDIEKLCICASDNNKITDIEKKTLFYISNTLNTTEKAKTYLKNFFT